MIDLPNFIKREKQNARATARKELFKLVRKAETWSEKDAHKVFDLCGPAEIDPAWLAVFAAAIKTEADAAKLAEALSDRQAAKAKAEAALQQAQQQRDEAIRAAEVAVAMADAQLHSAKLLTAESDEAARMVADLRERFAPLFSASDSEFANMPHINVLPALLAAAAQAAGLPDRQTGMLPPIVDPFVLAEREAEQRRQAEIRRQQTVAAQNAQRRAAMAARPAMARE